MFPIFREHPQEAPGLCRAHRNIEIARNVSPDSAFGYATPATLRLWALGRRLHPYNGTGCSLEPKDTLTARDVQANLGSGRQKSRCQSIARKDTEGYGRIRKDTEGYGEDDAFQD